MITALLGRPGSGKSYEATRLALRELERGRVVITTLPLNVEHEHWKPYLDNQNLIVQPHRGEARPYGARAEDWHTWIDPTHQRMIGEHLAGPYIVLDETVYLWSSIDRGEKAPKRVHYDAEAMVHFGDPNAPPPNTETSLSDWGYVERFIATQRHSGVDMVWIAQQHAHFPIEVKQLVEEWIELSSTRKHGVGGGYAWASYSKWYAPRERIDGGFRKLDKKIFPLYDTHALGTAAGSGGETNSLFRNRPIWLRPPVILLVLALCGIGYFVPDAWSRISSILHGEQKVIAPAEAKLAEPPPPEDPALPASDKPAAPAPPPPPPPRPDEEGPLPPSSLPLVEITPWEIRWTQRTLTHAELLQLGAYIVHRRPCRLTIRHPAKQETRTWNCHTSEIPQP